MPFKSPLFDINKKIPTLFLSFVFLLFSSYSSADSGSINRVDSIPAKNAFYLQKLFVKGFKFIGNHAITESELLEICRPYANTQMSFEQLQALSQKLTYHLINKGYSNSGVIIPDQQIEQGIVTFQVVEGKVSSIEISGNRNLGEDYIRQNMSAYVHVPVNIFKVREGLQLLEQNPRIKKVNAGLKADSQAGESVLHLKVEENKAYKAWLQISNDYSPSIGSNGIKLNVRHNNLFGYGDTFYGNISTTEESGLWQYEANYSYPFIRARTSLGVHLQNNDTTVIEAPFNDLDIKSNSDTFGLSLTHTLKRSPEQKFDIGIRFDLRRSESELLGRDYNFEDGSTDSDTRLSVLRLFQDWTKRTQNQVIALHSSFNIGLKVFNATLKQVGADGRFLSWNGQLQILQRLQNSNNQLLFKAYGQLSRDPLLAMERISLGGVSTVRGYRENELVGDNGYALSLAMRIPLANYFPEFSNITLEPFIDYGRTWDSDRLSRNSQSISGAGIGVQWQIQKGVDFSLFGAKAFNKREHAETSLQDEGLHFNLSLTY